MNFHGMIEKEDDACYGGYNNLSWPRMISLTVYAAVYLFCKEFFMYIYVVFEICKIFGWGHSFGVFVAYYCMFILTLFKVLDPYFGHSFNRSGVTFYRHILKLEIIQKISETWGYTTKYQKLFQKVFFRLFTIWFVYPLYVFYSSDNFMWIIRYPGTLQEPYNWIVSIFSVYFLLKSLKRIIWSIFTRSHLPEIEDKEDRIRALNDLISMEHQPVSHAIRGEYYKYVLIDNEKNETKTTFEEVSENKKKYGYNVVDFTKDTIYLTKNYD